MKKKETKLTRFSGQYLAALRSHVELPAQSGKRPEAAQELGTLAITCKLETLDLARIHDQALTSLLPAGSTAAALKKLTARGTVFFNEAITPIEETHRGALEAGANLNQLNATLVRRTLELASSQLELQGRINDRKTTEAALASSKKTSAQMFAESRLLEKRLKQMAHKILSANEAERKKMSLQLHDEIAQTLLGIHVRLLALKKDAAVSNAGLTKEISTTQRLLEKSVKTINRFAREFGTPA